MTNDQNIKKAIAPWRQFAMASINEADNGDHAGFIAGPMMQE